MKINISFGNKGAKEFKESIKSEVKNDYEEMKGNVKGIWDEYGRFFKAGFAQGAGCALGIIVVSKIANR